VLGLLSTGDTASSAVRRGIEYLLEGQNEDGSWTETAWTGTGFPSVFYLRYHLYPIYFPLLALGTFEKLCRHERRDARGVEPHVAAATPRVAAP